MLKVGSHIPEEAAHILILHYVIQVSFATITRFLHSATTISSHDN
jgi:hypothetical protein